MFERYSQMDPDLQSEVDLQSSEESTVESDDEEEDTDDNQGDANVDSPDNEIIRDYDVVDMLPPFCKYHFD